MNQTDGNNRDEAYIRIRRLIADGDIDPGAPISERSMAELLGFGRTPVREALKNLAREGVLDVVPMRGTFLRQPSLDEVREIYEVRLAIESMAAALVAQRGPPAALLAFRKRLKAYLKRSDARSIAAMHRVGWDFHSAIVAATGNRRMVQTYDALRLPIMAARKGRPVGADQARRSLIEHLAILDAIEKGDAPLAQARIGRHLAGVLEARAQLDLSAAAGAATFSTPSPPKRRTSK
jgi:DNA-binding GntR family transcriptional regulator